MTLPVVQYSEVGVASGATTTITFTARTVTAGRALCVAASQTGAANRTYSTSDNNSNTWGNGAQQANANANQAFADYALNANGGSTTVTITASASASFLGSFYEVSDADALDVAAVGNADTGGDKTYEGFNPAVDIAADSFVLVAGVHNANAGTLSSAGGVDDASNTQYIHFHHIRSSAATSQQETWSGTGSARQHAAVAFSLKSNAGGGGGTTPKGVFGKALYGPLRRVVM